VVTPRDLNRLLAEEIPTGDFGGPRPTSAADSAPRSGRARSTGEPCPIHPASPTPGPESDAAAVQRARDLAAYWRAEHGEAGQQVAEGLEAVLDGVHRPLPTATPWAWPPPSTAADATDGSTQ
jgi:hypothetical protein